MTPKPMSITSVVLDYTKAGLTPAEFEDIGEVAYTSIATMLTQQDGVARKSWSDAPEKLRENVLRAVKKIANNLTLTPQDMHEEWRLRKRSEGWTYEPKYNQEKKRHPQLLPYKYLRYTDRLKDALFYKVVHTLIDFKTHL